MKNHNRVEFYVSLDFERRTKRGHTISVLANSVYCTRRQPSALCKYIPVMPHVVFWLTYQYAVLATDANLRLHPSGKAQEIRLDPNGKNHAVDRLNVSYALDESPFWVDSRNSFFARPDVAQALATLRPVISR
jgi:hypothetical protein